MRASDTFQITIMVYIQREEYYIFYLENATGCNIVSQVQFDPNGFECIFISNADECNKSFFNDQILGKCVVSRIRLVQRDRVPNYAKTI